MKKNLVLLFTALIFLSVGMPALAAFGFNLPNPLCLQTGPICINDFPTLITNITDYIFNVVGFLATLMLVIAGVMFVISAGNPGKIDSAKKAAIYAAVGLAIALAGKGLIAVIKAVVGV